jgi:hypothetical protein
VLNLFKIGVSSQLKLEFDKHRIATASVQEITWKGEGILLCFKVDVQIIKHSALDSLLIRNISMR